MSISKDLFMSILAMDAYNREYNAGIVLDSHTLGNATVKDHEQSGVTPSEYEQWQASGFYAAAYTISDGSIPDLAPGQTVISYRGTDRLFSAPWSDDPGSDVWNGYLQGGGLAIANQSKLAAKFFQSVTGTSSSDPSQGNAIVTGHSLGGGLAGFVASIYGQQGYLFDNMAFELAAGSAASGASNPDNAIPYNSMYFNGYGPTGFKIGDNLHAYATTGEFLWANRVFQKTNVTAIDSNGGLRSTVHLHSQALLVNILFAKENNLTDWSSVGKPLLDALFNRDVGAAAGFSAGSVETGYYDPQYKMLAAIGYSALDGGAGNTDYGYVFGNTAIRAMFNDADELGSVVTAGKASEALRFGIDGVAQAVVQFAGLMAFNKVNFYDYESEGSQFHPRDGILKLAKADGTATSTASDAAMLELSVNQDLWKLGQKSDAPDIEILGVTKLLESVFNRAYGIQGEPALNVMYHSFSDLYGQVTDAKSMTKAVGSIQFSLENGPLNMSLAASDTAYDGSHVSVFATTDKGDIINGNKQNNFIAGAAGDDILYGRLGKDILLGGSGSDTFIESITEKDSADGRQNEKDVYIGSSHYEGLLANFINWWLHPNETDVVRYTVEDFSTDDPMTKEHESPEQAEGIRVAEIRLDPNYGGAEAIMVTTEDLSSGAKGTDALIGIERIELSDRPDELLINDDALKAAIVIDMGASGRVQSELRTGETLTDDAFLTKVDVADYSGVSHGIIYLNGETHYHHEVSANNVASLFSFAEQMEAIVSYAGKQLGLPNSNDNLRVEGADKIILTDHDDVIINADYGSLVETGDGHDNVWIMDGVGITDLSKDDRVTLAGVLELHGGLKSAGSETPWAYGLYGTVYGLNDSGELQIKNLFWNVAHKNENGTTSFRPATLYILNWAESYQERADGAGGIGGGNIYLAEYSITSSLLADLTADSRRSASIMGEGLYTILAMALKTIDPKTGFGGEDPLVLDLDGDGIELTKYDATKSRIDTDGDLYAEKTAFAAKDDGVLARDLNGNGKMDGASELFGHSGVSGFSDLAKLDGNHDGVISAADNGLADFNGDGVINANDTIASLLVWQDKNENNVTDVGELSTLTSREIVSITLPTTTIDATAGTLNNGNRVGTVSSYTLADGTTRDIADVALRVNNQLTTYVGPAITVSASVSGLADLKGFGTLVSLHQAMSVSSASETAVRSAVTSFSRPELAALREALRPILIAWAEGSPVGVDGVVKTGILNTRSYDDLAYVRKADNTVTDYVWGYSGESGNFETFAGDDQPKAEFAFASGVLVTVNGGGTINGRSDVAALIADMTAANHLAANGGDVSVTVGTTTNDQAHTVSYVQFARGTETLRIYHYDDADWSRSLAQSANPSMAGQSFAVVQGEDIAFYDRLIGESLKAFYVDPASATGGYNAVSTLLDKMEDTLNLFAVRVAVQSGPLAHYFESVKYDIDQDGFVSTDGHQLASVFSSLLADAEATSNPTGWLAEWKPFFDVFIADYHRGNIYQTNNYPFLLQQMQNAVEQHPGGISVLDYAQAFSIPFDAIVSGSGSLNGSNTTDILIIDGDETYAAGSGGADNYIIGRDFHSMEIFDQDEGLSHYIDTIRFSSHNIADIDATRVGADLFLMDKVTGQTIKVTNEFEGRWPGPSISDASYDYGINQIIFADGTTWSEVEIAEAVSKIDNASTTIVGSAATDVLQGGKGDDILKGGGDTDIYRYGVGDGNDTIDDVEDNNYRNDMDMLQFIDGIRLKDLSFERNGASDDVTIRINASEAGSILIKGQFEATYTGVLGTWFMNRIELFTFDDGTSFSYDRLAQMAIDAQSTSGNDNLFGMSREDVLMAGKGDDYVSGGNENDIYVFNKGDGHDVLQDVTTNILSGMNDTLRFGQTIKATDISFSHVAGDYSSITLNVAGTSDTVTLKNEYQTIDTFVFGYVYYDRIESVEFTDGSGIRWTWDQLAAFATSAMSTQGDDFIDGFSLSETLNGGQGNDTIFGRSGDDTIIGGLGQDILNGNDGNDTYLYARGDGSDTITEEVWGGFGDKLIFSDIGVSDITLSYSGTDLTIFIKESSPGAGDGVSVHLVGTLIENNGQGFENITFADGNSWSAVILRAKALETVETAGDDFIIGFNGSESLNGGHGNDHIEGGDGNDTYLYVRGDGNDTIVEAVWEGLSDTLKFTDIGVGDVALTYNGTDLTIAIKESVAGAGDAGAIKLVGTLIDNNGQGVENIVFNNGTTWNAATIRAKALLSAETSGDDNVVGFNTADTIVGGLGNDVLRGGDGDDTYIYTRGDGSDTIIEDVWGGLADRLLLKNINAADVALSYTGTDLTLTIQGTNEQLLLSGTLTDNHGQGIESIVFDDGMTWTAADLRAKALLTHETANDDTVIAFTTDDTLEGGRGDDLLKGGWGDDVYLYSRGDGNDVVDEAQPWSGNDDRVIFKDINPSEVVVLYDGQQLSLEILESVAGAADGGSIKLPGTYSSSAAGGIERVIFADGTVWSRAELIARAVSPSSSANVLGTDGNDTLNGSAGSDGIKGGKGDDTMNGGPGDDTYFYTRGDGNDVITENSLNGYDVLSFTGVNSTNVTLVRNANDLVLQISETVQGSGDGGSVKLVGNIDTGSQIGVEKITFADGISWTNLDILKLLTTISGTVGNDSISGTWAWDIIRGGQGDDTINGGDGNDIYLYSRGDGNDVIREDSWNGSGDRLVFTDVKSTGISLSYSGSDLNIMIAESSAGTNDGGTVKLQATLVENFGQGVDSIVFADGVVWDAAAMRAKALQTVETAGNDNIVGFQANDTIAGGAGDDTMNGGSGNDTYYYSRGDGYDKIYEDSWNGSDTLIFTNINAANTRVSYSGADFLIEIWDDVTGTNVVGSVKLMSTLVENFGQGIEKVIFADGTSWNAETMRSKALSSVETDGNDNIVGFNTADTIRGGRGNDTMNGGGGNDTYLFAAGDGSDVIYEDSWNGGGDKLKFLDVNENDVSLSYSGTDLTITLKAGVAGASANDKVLLKGTLTEFFGQGVDNIEFADGTTWTAAAMRDKALQSVETNGDDNIIGFGPADTIIGSQGNDTMNGLRGDDTYIYTRGDGNDTITDEMWNGDHDKLVFTNINAADVSLFHLGADLTIFIAESALGAGDAASIKLVGTFGGTYGQGVESVVFADGTTWGQNIFTQLASSDGDDTLVGTANNDRLSGGLGNDSLSGGVGNDIIIGGAGADSLFGGDGNDTIYVDQYDTAYSGDDGIDTLVFIGAGSLSYSLDQGSFENVTTADGSDTVWGTDGANVISLGAGDDTAQGYAGDDIINGGAGADSLIGGDGNDTIYIDKDDTWYSGDNGVDTLIFTGTGSLSYALGQGGFENVTTAAGNDTIWGTDDANIIDLGAGDDSAQGYGGDDIIMGGAGADSLQGGDGNDTIYVDQADTWYSGDDGVDTLIFTGTGSLSYALAQGGFENATTAAGDDTIWGTEGANVVSLGAGNDVAMTYAGNDVVDGGDGNDFIDGGADNDTLTGGAGNDTFVFHAGFGQDTITDFTAGAGSVDVIQVDTNVFADFAAVMNAASQVGADTVITADASNVITLKNVTLSSLHQDDFSFAVAS